MQSINTAYQPATIRNMQDKSEHKQIMNKQLCKHVYFNRLLEGVKCIKYL